MHFLRINYFDFLWFKIYFQDTKKLSNQKKKTIKPALFFGVN